jgi:hypothetical protein
MRLNVELEEAIGFGNRFHSLFFYAPALGLSRHLSSGEKVCRRIPGGPGPQIIHELEREIDLAEEHPAQSEA